MLSETYILSLISLFFYSVVYFPQFVVIYKTKSSEGISIWMLILWSQADALSLFGTILLFLPTNFVIMGWYHFLIGISLICFTLFYAQNTVIQKCSALLFILANIVIGIILNVYITESKEEIGNIIAWFTMSFYLIGRLPQIYMNWSRKTTNGLSLLMYVFTILGNMFYILVIFSDREYLNKNIPWLITGFCSMLLDILVIIQHYYYIRYNRIKNVLVY